MDGSIIILDFSTGADGPVLLGNLAVAGPQPGKAVINVTGRLQELRSGADYLDHLGGNGTRKTSSLPVALLVPHQQEDKADLRWWPPQYFRAYRAAAPTFDEEPLWLGPDIPMAFGKSVVDNAAGEGAVGEKCFVLLGTRVAVLAGNRLSCDSSLEHRITHEGMTTVVDGLRGLTSGKLLVVSLLRKNCLLHSTWALLPTGALPKL